MSYIGLDVGTSGCKAAIVEKDGTIRFIAGAEYSFESPQPGYVELNPATVWNAVRKVLCQIAPHAQDAAALAVASIGESMVMLDQNDQPLYNGIVYLDQRCKDIPQLIEQKISPRRLHEITGVANNQMFTLNKFIWFGQHHPDILAQAKKYFLFGDYITYMLSGKRSIDAGTASRTMFFDAGKRCWSQEIADLFGIPLEKFSPVDPSGTVLSVIRPELALETGLPESLSILTGLHDQCSATLGSGSLKPGDIMMGLGSTESINMVVHKDSISQAVIEREICFEPYIDDDHFIFITGNLTHGSSIKWFMNTIGSGLDYDHFTANCPETAGDVFFIPYLSKVNLMDSKNLALGGFLGIDVTVTRETMYRALLECLCFESKINLDIFEQLGIPIGTICASGGTAKVPLYMQLKADTLRYPIHVSDNPQAGIMGLAVICARSQGDYATFEDAAIGFIKCEKKYLPMREYRERYTDYVRITNDLKRLYNTLNSNLNS